MDYKLLREIGLTDAEIRVYMELIKTDSAMASEVAEKVGIFRTNVYDLLESLIEKGLVSYIIKANRKHFIASKPQRLFDYLKEKEDKIREQEKQVKKLIPSLFKLKGPKTEELKAEIYRGREGLKTLLNDMLSARKIIHYLGYSGVSFDIIPYYTAHWQKKRVNKKIVRKILTKTQMRNSKALKYPFTKARFLPDHYNTPISTMIYNNKIWILMPSDNDHVS
ncbi:hypothetical protein HYU10_05400 [Candidatus Woesearchaeota archaeon]|nr:hypothetical protein [Candidatus Woesearchaeota archaeon]